jgi:predicted RNA-binding Zn ribbon-like protein
MGALEMIRDFVNTADFEQGREDLTDPAARELREALRTLLRANNGVAVDVAGASRVADLRVGFDGGTLVFESTERILAAVAETMADGSWPRLKACRSDTCQFAFIDTARNRSRQWCDMAICGNREKARRFRSRHA